MFNRKAAVECRIMSHISRLWTALLLLSRIWMADLQIQMPMYPVQTIFAVPPPPPVMLPVQVIQLPPASSTTTTTTTTTTEATVAIALPFPMPMPVQIAVPAMPAQLSCQNTPRPKNCPPCPPCLCTPSCTPAFFSYCSPCHLKCRCRNSEDTPSPLPPIPPIPMSAMYPSPGMVIPPPAIIVPFPPSPVGNRPNNGYSDESSSDTSYDSCNSSDRDYRKDGRRIRSRRLRNRRRNTDRDETDSSDDDLLKPVLSYISRNGKVKLQKHINSDEAASLLGERRNVKVLKSRNKGISRSRVVFEDEEHKDKGRRGVLRKDISNHILDRGNRKVVFQPAGDKRITNMTLTFNVD